MKEAVGQWTAEPFVKKEEQECNLNALGGEQVRVTAGVTLEESVSFQLAQIVAELVQAVSFRREVESGDDGLVDLFSRPAADGIAAVQENLQ